MKKLFIIIVVLGTIAVVTGGYYYQQYKNFLSQPVFQESTVINVEKGLTYRKFTHSLLNENANGKKWQWRMLGKLEQVGK